MSEEKSEDSATSPKPYSIFTRKEKWLIVSLIAIAGFYSPLTATIYLPAIPAITNEFHRSTELINLTVTVYMVFQGVAPMFWGTLSDNYGRRPMLVACLLVLALSCVGLALVPTSAYWLLVLLRCLQAVGSASTIALGAGVIGDISTRAERGGFYGMFLLGPMVGPAVAPVLAGVLSNYLGWRSIFWFLCIAAFLCLLAMILVLPETLRALVGDGSIVPSRIYRPIIPVIGRKSYRVEQTQQTTRVMRNPLRLLAQGDILGLLLINAVISSSFYIILAPVSTLFEQAYPFLDQTTIGLCFLSFGGGTVLGSLIWGKVLDREYQTFKGKISKDLIRSEKSDIEEARMKDEMFPLEKARLRLLPPLLAIFAGICAGYGWCLQKQVNIAGPLILQFFLGYISIAVMNSASTLMIDLVPTQSSSVTACSNLVRCNAGAVCVSVVQLIFDRIDIGWTYVVFAGFSLLAIPITYVVILIGPSRRAKRDQQNRL